MTIIGGLRDRLIMESVRVTIEDGLRDLGWFDDPNYLRTMDLKVVADDLDKETELLPNIVCVVAEDTDGDEAELGSNFTEFVSMCAVDIYAEDAATGKHMMGDIRAILEGRLPSIGRTDPEIAVFDFSLATPTQIFIVEIENLKTGKQREYNKPFEKYWYTIVFDIHDFYGDEND